MGTARDKIKTVLEWAH